MRELVLLIAGFVVWSAAFLGIYAVQATGCAMGVDPVVLRWALIALTVAAILVCLGIAGVSLRWRGVLRISAICASVAALVATALTFTGVLWMQLC